MGHYNDVIEHKEYLDRFYKNHKEDLECLVGLTIKDNIGRDVTLNELFWDNEWKFSGTYKENGLTIPQIYNVDGSQTVVPLKGDIDIKGLLTTTYYREEKLNDNEEVNMSFKFKVGQRVKLRNGIYGKVVGYSHVYERFEVTHDSDTCIKPCIYYYKEDGLFCGSIFKEYKYDVVEIVGEDKEEKPMEEQKDIIEAHGAKWEITHSVSSEDMVKKPNHKILFEDVDLGIEINNIQIIASALTHEQFIGFILGQIMDYRFRAGKKWNKLEEDIQKADYLMELYHKYKHLTTDYGLVKQ